MTRRPPAPSQATPRAIPQPTPNTPESCRFTVPGIVWRAQGAVFSIFLALSAVSVVGSLMAGCTGEKKDDLTVEELFRNFEASATNADKSTNADITKNETLARVATRPISREELLWSADRTGADRYFDTADNLIDNLHEKAELSDKNEITRARDSKQLEENIFSQLIDRELLVAEALKRGCLDQPALKTAQKRAMIRQLLAEEVEAPADAEEPEAEALTEMLANVRERTGYPPGLQASHLLIRIPTEDELKKKGLSPGSAQNEQWLEQAQQLMEQLREDLPPAPQAYELFEVRDAYQEKLPEPLEIHVNAHLVFPIGDFLTEDERPADGFGRDLPETWRPVVEEFGRAATQMAREGRLGELSDPVQTPFGVHLIVPEKVFPGQVGDPDDIEQVARHELRRRRRNQRLQEVSREWIDAVHFELYPEVITEAEQAEQ